MRIAAFIRLWHTHREVGGMQQHAFNLYSGLVKAGHEVNVFTTFHPSRPQLEADHGIYVHYISDCTPAIYSESFFKNSKTYFEKLHAITPFDIIHSESHCARHLITGNLPIVVTWHGVSYCSLRNVLNLAALNGQEGKYLAEAKTNLEELFLEIEAFPKYDHHVAISHQANEDLLKIYHLPKSKVSCVLNGFDTASFDIDIRKRYSTRKKYNIPDDAMVLGIVGRLVEDKGHWLFIKILPWLLQETRIYILIVGEGPYLETYQALNNPRIKFAGIKRNKDMPAYYNSFDVFINPTTRYLGLDMTIQEAMLCGVPVVAANVGSVKKSLLTGRRYGRTFELLDSFDFCKQIYKVLSELNSFKKADIRNHIMKICSQEVMCKKMIGIFEKMRIETTDKSK